jgi:hypothetical protein
MQQTRRTMQSKCNMNAVSHFYRKAAVPRVRMKPVIQTEWKPAAFYLALHEFRKSHDLLADSNNILNRWKSYFSQLLNMRGFSTVSRWKYTRLSHWCLNSSLFEVEIAIAKLKKYKSPGSDQIPVELIQVVDEILWSEIHQLINFVWGKEELADHIGCAV